MPCRTCARGRPTELVTATTGIAAKAGVSAHHAVPTARCVSTAKRVAPAGCMAAAMLRPDGRQSQRNNARRHGKKGTHHPYYSPAQAEGCR